MFFFIEIGWTWRSFSAPGLASPLPAKQLDLTLSSAGPYALNAGPYALISWTLRSLYLAIPYYKKI